MSMTPEEKAKWERTRLECLASNAPTLLLLALRYWHDKDNQLSPSDFFAEKELNKRQAADRWMDEQWCWHNGSHPYTQEQIIAKYREINPA